MQYEKIQIPERGDVITMNRDFRLNVPDSRSSRSWRATASAGT